MGACEVTLERLFRDAVDRNFATLAFTYFCSIERMRRERTAHSRIL